MDTDGDIPRRLLGLILRPSTQGPHDHSIIRRGHYQLLAHFVPP